MSWDYDTFQAVPPCMVPIAIFAFMALFAGLFVIWGHFMSWTLRK